MEDVLRWSLIVVGSVVIIGVAVHGIWVSRKNSEQNPKKNKTKPELQTEDQYDVNDDSEDSDITINLNDTEDDGTVDLDSESKTSAKEDSQQFDDLGLGSVRVVSSVSKTEDEIQLSESDTESANTQTGQKQVLPETKVEPQSNAPAGKIYASVVTQPKPEYAQKKYVSVAQNQDTTPAKMIASAAGVTQKAPVSHTNPQVTTTDVSDGYQAPEPPPFLLKKEAHQELAREKDTLVPVAKEEQSQVEEKPSLTEQARNLVKRKKTETSRKRREPKIAEDQMKIDFDEEVTEQIATAQPAEKQPKGPQTEQSQEVLVLNVKTPDGQPISGAALLPMLLTLGFKFGDQDIFHRHVNSNGKGPVLFSLANMFKPGVFDIDNLENFTTQGVSLFMILPIEGEPHQVFNMMHNAARKISEEFSAQIYDAKRALLTKQSLQQYVEKIREFERQRMLNNG